MSFNPNSRVSVPTAFSPRSGGNSQFQQSPVDRLGTVLEYGQYTDASQRRFPTIVVREDETGRIIEARMSDRAADAALVAKSSNANANPDNFRGNIIDELMQTNIPVGDRVVLEGTMFVKGGKISVGGVERSVMECNYITHVTEPSPKKAFRAVFTVKADTKRPDGASEDGSTQAARVRDVQLWDDKAYASQEEIANLVSELDGARSAFEAGERRPGRGIQFRVVVPNGENLGKPLYEVIDSSPPFEWVRAERDPNDNTKILTDGYPLDGGEFRNLYAGYKDYIFGNEAEGQPAKFDAAVAATAQIEVMAYNSHMASSFSKYLKFGENPRHPLRRLCFTPTKGSADDETYMYGKNWAVLSVVMLTGDQFDKATSQIVNRDMVRRLFFGGPTGNIHSFVRTSEGHKARASLAIDNPARAERLANGGSGGSSYGGNQSSYQAPRPPSAPGAKAPERTAAPAPANTNGMFDDDDNEAFEAKPSVPASSAIPFEDASDHDFFHDLLNGGGDGDGDSDASGSDEGGSDASKGDAAAEKSVASVKEKPVNEELVKSEESAPAKDESDEGKSDEGKSKGAAGRRSRNRPE